MTIDENDQEQYRYDIVELVDGPAVKDGVQGTLMRYDPWGTGRLNEETAKNLADLLNRKD